MKIDSLDKLLLEELKDIYDAEKRMARALPKMVKKASAGELRAALEEHYEVTKGQVSRLEEVFDLLGAPVKATPCAGMKGMIEECDEVMKSDIAEPLMDQAIIAAAQRGEHYEIAAYGTARAVAERLGNTQVADLLEETLNEEKECDMRLTEVAEQLYEQLGEPAAMGAGAGRGRVESNQRKRVQGKTRTSRA